MLSACVQHTFTNTSYCVIQKFQEVLAGGSPILNEMECPYMLATHNFEVVPSCHIHKSISLIHECSDTCKLQEATTTLIERKKVSITGTKILQHDATNDMYFLNVYCVNNYHI